MRKFELGYSIHDQGDGSVSVKFFPSRKLAEEDEEKEQEEGSTCWGETCASATTLVVIDGRIYLDTYEYKLSAEDEYERIEIRTPLEEI